MTEFVCVEVDIFFRCLQGYLFSISLFTDYWPIKNYSSEHVYN